MTDSFAEAGSRGPAVRSDCWAGVTMTSEGGVDLTLESKVDVMFGRQNRELVHEMMTFFGVKNARVELVDSGAVPFVLMARLEAALRRLGVDDGKRFLPPWLKSVHRGAKDRPRRSRLYLPGDQPRFFINAPLHGADGLILDLEDSVAPAHKDAARILVRNALRALDFRACERMVRINQLPLGLEDLEEVLPHRVDVILIPKVETPMQIYEVEKKIEAVKETQGDSFHEPYLMPIVESALGVINAYLIASASPRVVALAIGLEDYTADIGTHRTQEGKESFFARSMVVNAARAAEIQPIDTVYSDVIDMDGLAESVREARAMGFEGKGCIHPRQIPVIHRAFAPTSEEIEKARKIVLAFEAAEREEKGVVSLGSKMIDPPVVKRALHTIDLAEREGLLEADWRDNNVQ